MTYGCNTYGNPGIEAHHNTKLNIKRYLQCSHQLHNVLLVWTYTKKIIVSCVQITQADGSIKEHLREFRTFDADLRSLTQWLKSHEVQTIVMESTGIYWKHLYALLEQADLPVLVVNARHVKQVPGRKTDVKDSQWLATLARFGLLRGSFIPVQDLRELRLLAQYRLRITQQLTGEKNRLHKLLDDAGIRLGCVVSDINGVSAQALIQGLIDGKSFSELVDCVRGRLKSKVKELALAMDCPLSKRHRFLLVQLQNHIQELEKRIATLDEAIFNSMQPYDKQWRLLQTIPGMNKISAAITIIVIGTDMARFGSQHQLCAWAGLCPGQNESAGKRRSGRTCKGNNLLRQTLCQVAHAAVRTHCQFKNKHQSLVIRRGYKRAIIAIAHKILRVIYSVLSNLAPYRDPDIDFEALMVKRNAPRWVKMLEKHGHLTTT